MSGYGYSNPNQTSVPAPPQQATATPINFAVTPPPPEPTGITLQPGSTLPDGGTFPPRPPINPQTPNYKVYSLRDSNKNFITYVPGDLVLFEGDTYEVLFKTFGLPPNVDTKKFRKINEKTDVSIIDGGEF